MNDKRPRSMWCRCGWSGEPQNQHPIEHHGLGHRVVLDDYRAWCKPHLVGCRNCATMPQGRNLFWCSDQCRVEFNADHFYGEAIQRATLRASIFDVDRRRGSWRRGVICQRCWEPIGGKLEVNHIVPVNGRRMNFGCSNHQSNLEALDHACHLVRTAEQRQAGLLGKGADIQTA